MRENVLINNEKGLHARPAAGLIQEAMRFEADIFLVAEDKRANAKSIMSVMMLGVKGGAAVALEAEGVDAEGALRHLKEYIETQLED